jgi:hypothetical protein
MKFLLFLTLACSFVANTTLAQRTDTTTNGRLVTQSVSAKAPMTFVEKAQSLDAAGGGGAFFGMVRTFDNRYEGLQGTPYFSPVWANGRIELTDDRRYTNVPIKFDAYRQHLILRRPAMNDDSIVVDWATVRQFELDSPNGQPYVFRRYPAIKTGGSAVRDDYFMVLYDGKTTLLKHIAKTFRAANFKDPYSPDERHDSFADQIDYYLLRPDQTLVKIKKSLKSLAEALEPRQAEVKAFAAREKIGGKTDQDLARLVQFYNELK